MCGLDRGTLGRRKRRQKDQLSHPNNYFRNDFPEVTSESTSSIEAIVSVRRGSDLPQFFQSYLLFLKIKKSACNHEGEALTFRRKAPLVQDKETLSGTDKCLFLVRACSF